MENSVPAESNFPKCQKRLSTINRSCIRHSQCALSSEVLVTEVWISQIKSTHSYKIWAAETISADLENLVECDQTAEATKAEGTVGLSLDKALVVFFFSGSWRSALRVAPSCTTGSDDGWWAGGGRVWVWRGGKVPEEPLALALAPLVQVVLLVALLACSLVVVVLFEVPHRRPAVLLKVLLVLCIRIICLRDGKGCNVFQDQSWQMLLHLTSCNSMIVSNCRERNSCLCHLQVEWGEPMKNAVS